MAPTSLDGTHRPWWPWPASCGASPAHGPRSPISAQSGANSPCLGCAESPTSVSGPASWMHMDLCCGQPNSWMASVVICCSLLPVLPCCNLISSSASSPFRFSSWQEPWMAPGPSSSFPYQGLLMNPVTAPALPTVVRHTAVKAWPELESPSGPSSPSHWERGALIELWQVKKAGKLFIFVHEELAMLILYDLSEGS